MQSYMNIIFVHNHCYISEKRSILLCFVYVNVLLSFSTEKKQGKKEGASLGAKTAEWARGKMTSRRLSCR